MRKIFVAAALAAPFVSAPAYAAPAKLGDPIKVSPQVTIDPFLDARLRYEHVDQPAADADAVTLRVRSGIELKHVPSNLALLAEAEATLGLLKDYNAYPGSLGLTNPPVGQLRPAFSVVADPENIDLNRLQLQYRSKAVTLTVGRQRINLDDQRWVGSVGWRQNEQTFDAVRGEAKLGPVILDATYSISQRGIWGYDARERIAMDGDFVFLGAGGKLGPIQVKAFAYLLDYDSKETVPAPVPLAKQMADSQTYGLRAVGTFKLAPKLGVVVTGSYARQSAYQDNLLDFDGDYIFGEGVLRYAGLTLTAGWEKLGSDATVAGRRAVQTPMATLHKFNGWADMFLTTPDNGLQEAYVGLAYKFDGLKVLPGLNAAVFWHQYDSDFGDIEYGTEWNASIGFEVGPVALLAKYADYNAIGLGPDTRKFWLQAEYSF